jgi:hypothetical protein
MPGPWERQYRRPPELKFSTVVATGVGLEIAAPQVSPLSEPGTGVASSTGVERRVEPAKVLQIGLLFIHRRL